MTRSILILTFILAVLLAAGGLKAQDEPFEGKPEAGEKVYKVRGCRICHNLGGDGGTVGPRLDQVTLRRDEEWLVKWLNDPKSVLDPTDMPKFAWRSKNDVFDIIAYLKTFRKEADTSFVGEMDPAEAGEKLTREYDCRACHKVEPGTGRPRYPSLADVGSRMNKDELAAWITSPQKIKPETFMPSYNLADKEVKAIAEYLSGLRK